MEYIKTAQTLDFLFIIIVLLSLLTISIVLNSPFQKVLAHISNQYGNTTIQAGWDQEPPLVDKINDVVVGVTRESDLGNGSDSAIPVRNALTDMNIMVKYGGVTKSLDFVPSQEQEGWYESKILPTRIGSYNLVLNGTIQDQPISDEVQIEDVESTQKLSFPEADIDDSGSLAESNSNIQEGIQNVKDIADRSYMIAITAIGVGAAGILIAVAALVRTR